MQTVPVITLDGPSGVGKGTVGMRLAKHLQWHYLDSGALYRLVAWHAQQKGVSSSQQALPDLVALVLGMQIDCCLDEAGTSYVLKLNDALVPNDIRSEQCGQWASKIAVYPEVRRALRDVQHACCRAPGLVADGRDMGSAIFPQAQHKFFLDASCEERARRRYQQLQVAGKEASEATILTDLKERDQRDRQRKVAPLQAASDAICIDTTDMDADAVFERILRVIRPLI